MRLPMERAENRHVYHQLVVGCDRRDELRAHLERAGVAILVHYPQAIHEIRVLRDRVRFRVRPRCAEGLARRLLSLSIYPELPPGRLAQTIDAICSIR